jgi:hypothetical protein
LIFFGKICNVDLGGGARGFLLCLGWQARISLRIIPAGKFSFSVELRAFCCSLGFAFGVYAFGFFGAMAPTSRRQSVLLKFLYGDRREDDGQSFKSVPFSDELHAECAREANVDLGDHAVEVPEVGSSAPVATPPPSAVVVLSDSTVDGAFLNATPVGIALRPRPRTALHSATAQLQTLLLGLELTPAGAVAVGKRPAAGVVAATTSASGASTSAVSESDMVILDPAIGSPAVDAARARRRAYEQNRHWQDSWATRLPWAESVMGVDGDVTQVRCRICTEVEGRKKLLVLKIDSLHKHSGHRKVVIATRQVKKGEFYYLSTNQYIKNERMYFARRGAVGETIIQQVQHGAVRERRRKLVQFRIVFWLLAHGRPMNDYEAVQELMVQLEVPECPQRHWSVGAGWEMADAIAHVLGEHTKSVMREAHYFLLSADEVSTSDNQSWLSLHAYIPLGFKRCSILLALIRLVDGNGTDAIRTALMSMVHLHTGLDDDDIANQLVSFDADGVSVFQGSRRGVTTQLQNNVAPFMLGIHCMAHRTNLAVEPLSNLPLVSKLEALCHGMYAYFSHNPKRHLKFQKLADVVETEGLRVLRNVTTRWISLLDPLRRIMGEYKTLLVKLCDDAAVKEPELTTKQRAAKDAARQNYSLLCDLGTLLSFSYFMPLLECVDSLMRFAQSNHVFVYGYLAVVMICLGELYMMYGDPETSFQQTHFQMFYDILDDHSYTISQEWVTDLNTGNETLSFRVGGHTYPAHSLCLLTSKKLPISRSDFADVVTSVKGQCQEAALLLRGELDRRFPNSDLMCALGVVFPQYWS